MEMQKSWEVQKYDFGRKYSRPRGSRDTLECSVTKTTFERDNLEVLKEVDL